MIIRPMMEADVAPMARLMAGDRLWQRYGVTAAGAARRLGDGLAAGATIAVAEVDGALAGFIWYVERGAFARSGYVMLIGVERGARRQGVGAGLMAHAEAAMFATAGDVFLLVSDFNLAAQRFYERLGYVRVGAIPDYVVAGVTELIYRKQGSPALSRLCREAPSNGGDPSLCTKPSECHGFAVRHGSA